MKLFAIMLLKNKNASILSPKRKITSTSISSIKIKRKQKREQRKLISSKKYSKIDDKSTDKRTDISRKSLKKFNKKDINLPSILQELKKYPFTPIIEIDGSDKYSDTSHFQIPSQTQIVILPNNKNPQSP